MRASFLCLNSPKYVNKSTNKVFTMNWEAFKNWVLSTTSIRRIDFLIGYGLFVLVCILGFNAVQNGADRALEAAIKAKNEVSILKSIEDEEICSATNQGDACRALFDRLANNLSQSQRLRLTCVGLSIVKREDLRRKINCPPLPPAPVP